MTEQRAEQPITPDQGFSIPPSTERGSERFRKFILIGTAATLTIVGTTEVASLMGGFIVENIMGLTSANEGLRSLRHIIYPPTAIGAFAAAALLHLRRS